MRALSSPFFFPFVASFRLFSFRFFKSTFHFLKSKCVKKKEKNRGAKQHLLDSACNEQLASSRHRDHVCVTLHQLCEDLRAQTPDSNTVTRHTGHSKHHAGFWQFIPFSCSFSTAASVFRRSSIRDTRFLHTSSPIVLNSKIHGQRHGYL